MGQVEILPTVQVASSGTYAATGAASALLALNDASDASYIKNSGSSRANATFMVADVAGSLPAGAVVQSVQMKFRYSHADRPNPSPYEIIKPVTVLIGRQVPIGGGLFKYVYEGYHSGQIMLDWVASTGITEVIFPLKRQTYDGRWFADIFAQGGRRFFVSLETLADPSPTNVARMYSISVLVNYNEKPAVVVVDPTGTYGIGRPTITWTYTDPDGDTQVLYHIKIFTAAQVAAGGFNVDTSTPIYEVSRWSSALQHTPEDSFYQGDGSYRVYVRAAQASIGNQQLFSDWDFNDFTLDLEEPQAPMIMVDHDPGMNVVMVEFQSHDNMLDYNQSSGELTTTAGVTADASCTVTNTSAQASHGTRSFQYTRTGTTGTASFRTTAGTGGVMINAGDLYTAFADVRTQTTARAVQVGISWYDAAGALLSTSLGAASNDASGSWAQRFVVAKAPANAAFAAVVVSAAAVVVGENHYADKLEIIRVHDHVYSLENATDLAEWTAGTNTTLALSTAQFQDGASSMSMTRTTSTGTAAAHTLPGGFGVPAVAGEPYEVSALFRAATVGRTCSVTFRFYDSASGLLSPTVVQVNAVDTTTGWVEASASVAAAPVNTAYFEIEVAVAGAAVSEVHYVDRIQVTNYAKRTWTRGGFSNSTSVMLGERSLDLGATWETFRDSIIMGEHHVMRMDGEVPSGAEVWYRGRVEAENQDGEAMTSVYSAIQRITVPVYSSWWLRIPSDLDAGNMAIRVREFSFDRPKPQNVGFPVEDTLPVVSHNGLKGHDLAATFDLLNADDFAAFWAMAETGLTLILQDVLGRQWYVQIGETTRAELYRAYPLAFENTPIRHAHSVEAELIEVARPSG